MNKYKIEQKIKTPSRIGFDLIDTKSGYPVLELDDFKFVPWKFSTARGCFGDYWVTESVVKAKDWGAALNDFRRNLDNVTSKIGFISQCSMDYYSESFLVNKINGQDNSFFYRHIQESDVVNLDFGKDKIEAYNKMTGFKNFTALKFLRESSNTERNLPKLMLIFSAVESLCDKVEKDTGDGNTYITYDNEQMVQILGGRLRNEIFGVNGLRHKILHGELPDFAHKDYFLEIYRKIIDHFNTTLGTEISQQVVSPQRHFFGNYEYIDGWLRPDKEFEISLVNLSESFTEATNSVIGCEWVFPAPAIY